jgi:hypothetical protein
MTFGRELPVDGYTRSGRRASPWPVRAVEASPICPRRHQAAVGRPELAEIAGAPFTSCC